MVIAVLAGPPAVGHNTVAELLAQGRTRSAIIDNDLVREMMIKPSSFPGGGPEWERQYELSIRNVCALARNFDDDGTDVFVLDVLEPEVVPILRQELSTVSLSKIILLTADPEILVSRDIARDVDHSADAAAAEAWHDRIRHLHGKLTSQLHLYDHCVDNSEQRPAETAAAVERLLH